MNFPRFYVGGAAIAVLYVLSGCTASDLTTAQHESDVFVFLPERAEGDATIIHSERDPQRVPLASLTQALHARGYAVDSPHVHYALPITDDERTTLVYSNTARLASQFDDVSSCRQGSEVCRSGQAAFAARVRTHLPTFQSALATVFDRTALRTGLRTGALRAAEFTPLEPVAMRDLASTLGITQHGHASVRTALAGTVTAVGLVALVGGGAWLLLRNGGAFDLQRLARSETDTRTDAKEDTAPATQVPLPIATGSTTKWRCKLIEYPDPFYAGLKICECACAEVAADTSLPAGDYIDLNPYHETKPQGFLDPMKKTLGNPNDKSSPRVTKMGRSFADACNQVKDKTLEELSDEFQSVPPLQSYEHGNGSFLNNCGYYEAHLNSLAP